MSMTRYWENYLTQIEREVIAHEDATIKWLLDRIILAKHRRQKIINRAIQRARLEESREGRQPRPYRKAA